MFAVDQVKDTDAATKKKYKYAEGDLSENPLFAFHVLCLLMYPGSYQLGETRLFKVYCFLYREKHNAPSEALH